MIILVIAAIFFFLPSNSAAQLNWQRTDSEHFIIVYLPAHQYLVPHIIDAAETSFATLSELLDYTASEKIVINTYDFSDYGSAAATTVPHNFIRLEIEPIEIGYESIVYDERFKWLISHELVHIFLNDMAASVEGKIRTLFSKVAPEKEQPLSILFSRLTNNQRYTPRWHQEGSAVFLETWLNGGYGRSLGSFDEMYFRTLVLERRPFLEPAELAVSAPSTSFLSDLISYIYGTRFITYLAVKYEVETLRQWYAVQSGDFYPDYKSRFRTAYESDILAAWRDFIRFEIRRQKENIARLKTAQVSKARRLLPQSLGWVSQPHYDFTKNRVFFAHHQPHHRTAIVTFDLTTAGLTRIGSVPAPGLLQVSSSAFDRTKGDFYYTTNNNRLYRDLWRLSPDGGNSRLFRDIRVGDITISDKGEIWGVQHSQGRVFLVNGQRDDLEMDRILEFEPGVELQHLAVSPSGKYLAAVLHEQNGTQSLVVAKTEGILNDGVLNYQILSSDGSPEFPSWSGDSEMLFWNAYTNGVSNIYRYEVGQTNIEAVSHSLSGFFRPIAINADSLFAFEFTSDGFVPVLLANKPAENLPAINYLGQSAVKRNPVLADWTLSLSGGDEEINPAQSRRYSGLGALQVNTFIPVISGFQRQTVVGFYSRFSDPLLTHDFLFELGISPFNTDSNRPDFHFKGHYEYNKNHKLEVEINAPTFYDLVNKRRIGMSGQRYAYINTHYWKYDEPHQIKQTTEVAVYRGIEAIHDNEVAVSEPDFAVFESGFNSKNIRRTIGSVDHEYGYDWTFSLVGLSASPTRRQWGGGFHAEWNYYQGFLFPHNIAHLKLAGGYLTIENQLEIGKYYFGGFGNQYLDHKEVRQYRDTFRFPGIPVYALAAERFAKLMFEHTLPPLRTSSFWLGGHGVSHLDLSWFSQALITDADFAGEWIDIGAQLNIVFSHWYNLESTLSFGAAKAWSSEFNDWEWIISLKLLRD